MSSMLPSTEEVGIVKGYSGDIEELAVAERFIKELIKIPDFKNRLKGLLFKDSYEEVLYELDRKVTEMTKSFTNLYDNERFHHILEVTLAVSNYLNGTGPRGGAWGFKLESMERIEETKSLDQK
jgi:hypothetical protein